MYERFTQRARRVMGLARQEAQRLNSEFIGSEHMLMAILEEGEGVVAKVLKNNQVDPNRVRQEIENLIRSSDAPAVALGMLPPSPRARLAIERAEKVSEYLGHDGVETEHLLLGILEDEESVAAIVLENLGVRRKEVHRMLLEVMGVAAGRYPGPITEELFTKRGRSVVLKARSEAERMEHSAIEPEHLLLAILGEGGVLSRLLAKRGVTDGDVEGVIREVGE